MPASQEEVFAYEVMVAGQLASILEVSGWPKPGNVHRTRDMPDVRYEHFLAGATALGPSLREAAIRGIDSGRGVISLSDVGIGALIKRAVLDVNSWHKGGNTHLGTCILLVPLAVAAGKTYAEHDCVAPDELRRNVLEVTYNTTAIDAVNVYEAIRIAGAERTLGRAEATEAPDVFDRRALDKLISENVTLYDVMKVSSEWDNVASEFVSGMRNVFKVGYPSIVENLNSTRDINITIVHAYLRLLSEVPDTLIARKAGLKETKDIRLAVKIGLEKTAWVSQEARKILGLGGLTTPEGRKALEALDERLHEARGELNPGTTADLLAASIMVALLCGLRY